MSALLIRVLAHQGQRPPVLPLADRHFRGRSLHALNRLGINHLDPGHLARGHLDLGHPDLGHPDHAYLDLGPNSEEKLQSRMMTIRSLWLHRPVKSRHRR